MNKIQRTLTIIVVFALAVAIGAWRLQQIQTTKQQQHLPSASSFHGEELNPVPAPNITLTNQDGQLLHLHDLKGDVTVLFFGFTSCPDVCPATLAHFKQVKHNLSEDADRVKFVMVSVDPERDTPERMREYVRAFDSEFIGLTGTPEEAKTAWDAYNVYPRRVELPNSALGYTVEHPAFVYVIDTEGDMRLIYLHGTPADDVAEDIQKLLHS